MIYTTLNEISEFIPRQNVGKTQPDDEPLPLVAVLDSAGLDVTIRCLRVCPDIAAEFARWCADRAATWDARRADSAAEFAEAADWAARIARTSDRPSFWAARAAEAAGSTSYWAAEAADWYAELQAQADKLRELLS